MKESEIILLARDGIFQGKKVRGRIDETHISWVILTRKVVFKIKKPVKLSFLDFSTVKLRKERCNDEIILNRRFTDIYRSVVPIRIIGSKYIIGGRKGRIIDYAVRMKRMAVTKRMDNVLKQDGVRNSNIISLASAVSSVHRTCKPIYSPFVLSEARNLFNEIHGVEKFLIKNAGSEYGGIIAKSIQWSDTFLKHHQNRFQSRIDEGFKRDVHGDLHSGNIFLYRKPVIFDCIEFNESFRQIDVLYEIAFLCMDLEAYNRGPLANKFLSEYNKKINCFKIKEDVYIFNYFKCLRANVRAKVHAMSATQAENDMELQFHLEEVKKYLDLMRAIFRSDKSLFTG